MSHTVTSGPRDQKLIRAIDQIAVSGADVHRVSLDAINLQVALDHAAAGMPVFPVRVLRGPNGKWQKRPAIKGWQQAATLDVGQIGRWWSEFPEALPGIELSRSGLFVVDADRHDSDADGVIPILRKADSLGIPKSPAT
jgi:Bifunctional DNA primase/polymerase, N-terminal